MDPGLVSWVKKSAPAASRGTPTNRQTASPHLPARNATTLTNRDRKKVDRSRGLKSGTHLNLTRLSSLEPAPDDLVYVGDVRLKLIALWAEAAVRRLGSRPHRRRGAQRPAVGPDRLGDSQARRRRPRHPRHRGHPPGPRYLSQRLTTVSRAELLRRLRRLGWDGPRSGTKHAFMVTGARKLRLLTPTAATSASAGSPASSIKPTSAAPSGTPPGAVAQKGIDSHRDARRQPRRRGGGC